MSDWHRFDDDFSDPEGPNSRPKRRGRPRLIAAVLFVAFSAGCLFLFVWGSGADDSVQSPRTAQVDGPSLTITALNEALLTATAQQFANATSLSPALSPPTGDAADNDSPVGTAVGMSTVTAITTPTVTPSPQPSYTPTPTRTPDPSITPSPTSKLTPAPTPIPTISIDYARAALDHQISYWTSRQEIRHDGRYPVELYLTYLAPQLIEATIQYQLALEGAAVTPEDVLNADIVRRLNTENRLPFILTIKADLQQYGRDDAFDLFVDIQSFMQVVNFSNEVSYTNEYDRVFDIPLASGVYSGYVFFPMETGDETVVDLETDPTIRVILENITYENKYGFQYSHSATWSYNLVPVDMPLETIIQRPITEEYDYSTQGFFDFLDLLLLILDIFSLFP